MWRNRLKLLRVAAALVFFAGLTAALADFRNLVPAAAGHWFAGTQLVPSLIALATGASLALAGIIIIVATLAAGRIYCSAICPLGILQDVVARLAAWLRRGNQRLLPFARPKTWLRQLFLWGTVGGVLAGWSGFTLSLVDPYSNFGRVVSGLFRPLLTLANNAVVGAAHAIGIDGGLYRVEPTWAGMSALGLPVIFLVLITVLVALRGRLYCNTLCPVGTLLGLFARRAAFRLSIDQGACNKCGACLQVCKSQCIDLRAGMMDFSRCVACYNCIGACEHGGIGYRFAWRWTSGRKAAAPVSPPRPVANLEAPDPQRRAFLVGTVVAVTASLGAAPRMPAQDRDSRQQPGRDTVEGDDGAASGAICPPGAGSVDRFLDRCTACHLCVSACPTRVLKPAFLEYGLGGLMMPRLDYSTAFCNYDCRRCGEVCPDGAIRLLDLADKQLTQIGETHLDVEKCIVKTKGTDCAACSEHCPTKAVSTVPYGNNLRLPEFKRELCIGCGACEYACPVRPEKAIIVTGRRRHGRAQKLVEKRATAPAPTGDFPF
ncbi:MAG: 4Fe-4S binding protein [Opitutaceae bacterium]|nr:4Fe-4S binding protein [Opitutaceae bacterium]